MSNRKMTGNAVEYCCLPFTLNALPNDKMFYLTLSQTTNCKFLQNERPCRR